jgi:hypothetical protein
MVAETPMMTQSASLTEGRVAPAHRVLGLIGMIASPFLFLSFAANGFSNGDSNKLGAVLGLVFAIGWFCNILGLQMLGAAGRRLPARILLGVALVGVSLAMAFQVFEFFTPGSTSLLYTITDIAWPLSMLLLLITGIVMIFARVFEGWLRFTPLIAALWLPGATICFMLFNPMVGQVVPGLHTALGWFLIGYAVYRGGKLRA